MYKYKIWYTVKGHITKNIILYNANENNAKFSTGLIAINGCSKKICGISSALEQDFVTAFFVKKKTFRENYYLEKSLHLVI